MEGNGFQASKGVGSNGILAAVAHKARGDQASPPFGVPVLDVEDAEVRVVGVIGAGPQEFGDFASDGHPGRSARCGSRGGSCQGTQSSGVDDTLH